MKARKKVVAYWLIPAEPQRELFREIVSILARQHDAPLFEPHVTLVVARQNEKAAAKRLRAIKAARVRLKIRSVASSSKFTKSLFVRLISNKSLDDLADMLAPASGPRSNPLRDPHMSFLYKKMPAAVKRELAATIKLPFREITFDSIKAVRCVAPTTTRREVEAWRVLATKHLR